MSDYNPRDWYWVVGGDESRAWSSASGEYESEYPGERATRVPNEVELFDVLARTGLTSKAPQRSFSAGEVRAALLAVDAGATADATTAEELQAVAANIGILLPPMEV